MGGDEKKCGAHDATRRRDAVVCAQRRLGMSPRADSQLTNRYAAGTCDPEYDTAEAVAEELVVVHHIYMTTLYGDIIEEVMRQIARWLKRRYRRVTWTQIWQIVRVHVPTMLKVHCLLSTDQRWQ